MSGQQGLSWDQEPPHLTLASGGEWSSALYNSSLIQAGRRAVKEREEEKALTPGCGKGLGRSVELQGKRLGEEEPVTADSSARWPGSQETSNMEPEGVYRIFGIASA